MNDDDEVCCDQIINGQCSLRLNHCYHCVIVCFIQYTILFTASVATIKFVMISQNSSVVTLTTHDPQGQTMCQLAMVG